MAIHRKKSFSLRLQFEKALFWILRSPLRSTVALAIFAASASCVECAIHLAVITSSATPLVQAFADSIILGIFAAIFGLLILMAARDRRQKLQDDLRGIAELNHQVRNSLQLIVYGERSPDIAERRAAVLEGVEKIELTLRELFPLVGDRMNDARPWESHNQVCLKDHNFHPERRRQPSALTPKLP